VPGLGLTTAAGSRAGGSSPGSNLPWKDVGDEIDDQEQAPAPHREPPWAQPLTDSVALAKRQWSQKQRSQRSLKTMLVPPGILVPPSTPSWAECLLPSLPKPGADAERWPLTPVLPRPCHPPLPRPADTHGTFSPTRGAHCPRSQRRGYGSPDNCYRKLPCTTPSTKHIYTPSYKTVTQHDIKARFQKCCYNILAANGCLFHPSDSPSLSN